MTARLAELARYALQVAAGIRALLLAAIDARAGASGLGANRGYSVPMPGMLTPSDDGGLCFSVPVRTGSGIVEVPMISAQGPHLRALSFGYLPPLCKRLRAWPSDAGSGTGRLAGIVRGRLDLLLAVADAEEVPLFLAFEFGSHREGMEFRRVFWEVRGSARVLPTVEVAVGLPTGTTLVKRARRASREGRLAGV